MSLRLISRRSCLQTLALLFTITLPSLTHAFLHPQPTLAGLSLRMAPPGHVTTRPAGQRWIPRAVPNKAAHNRFCHSLTSLRMTEETGEKDAATIEAQKKFDDLVAKNAAKEAINVLRGNDDVEVAPDQGWRLLNSIPLEMSEKTETEQQILTSLAYSSLRKKSLLRAFGCVEPSPLYLPYASKEIDVPMLEKTIRYSPLPAHQPCDCVPHLAFGDCSLPMKALTPRGTQFAWQVRTAVLTAHALLTMLLTSLVAPPLRNQTPLPTFLVQSVLRREFWAFELTLLALLVVRGAPDLHRRVRHRIQVSTLSLFTFPFFQSTPTRLHSFQLSLSFSWFLSFSISIYLHILSRSDVLARAPGSGSIRCGL